ncbi:energy transducer TonB [Undibacterium sp.]|jgi:protein TonB|uniref:energy transducer TonB n=1 Tax=Undibacterium sp. TaxID=1914977 RepID=UPI002B8E4254|nr:energy transducer TonB [Undibacterium sp.]HTD04502.1 energy transducer TonB [Undibacterium sp.]
MDFTMDERAAPVKKFTGLTLVILFHAALVYGLLHGLGHKIIQVIQEPLNVQLVDEVPPPPAAPDTPPPQIAAALPFIPPPEVSVPMPLQQDTIVAAATAEPLAASNSVAPATSDTQAAGPVRVPAVVDARACTKPAYPLASLRNEEAGTVSLSLLVGVDGKVIDSRVEKSSGYRSLDNAARAGLALCRFVPGTVDGKPEQFWTRIQYVWKLDDK